VANDITPDRIRVEPPGPVPYEAVEVQSQRAETAFDG
jgi:hypothetical protein